MAFCISMDSVRESAARLRSVLDDGPGTVNLLEPIDSRIRSDLLCVAIAYLVEHDEDEAAKITPRYLERLAAVKTRNGWEFSNDYVRVLLAYDQDKNWWAFIGGAVLPIANRRSLKDLLGGLQIK